MMQSTPDAKYSGLLLYMSFAYLWFLFALVRV